MANLPTSIKNLNTLLGEQLTEGGGGGSSDFSTAEVYFENQLDHMVVFNMPSFTARDEPMATASVVVPAGATARALIVLYQGKAVGGTDAKGDCTASGDIVYDDTEGLFTITGDGGITIS